MNPYIPHTDYTLKLNTITPTGAPCPVCGRGELWESPNVYGCDSCLRTFNETELFRIVADILDGVSDGTVDHLHEMTDLCLTESAHIRGASEIKSNVKFGSAAWFSQIKPEAY